MWSCREALERPVFPELFTDHRQYVERVLRSLGVHEADLDDLRQEVFVVVHRRLDSFEGRSTLRTWLYGICLRVAAGHRRTLRRRRERVSTQLAVTLGEQGGRGERGSTRSASASGGGDPRSPFDALALEQTAALIEAALAKLPAAQRDAFVMYELEQEPMERVAARLGCPLKTGFTRLYAARARVNRALERALGGYALLEFPRAGIGAGGGGATAGPLTLALPSPLASAVGAALASAALLLVGVPQHVPAGSTLDRQHAPRSAAMAARYELTASATAAGAPVAARQAPQPARRAHPASTTQAARESGERSHFEVEPIDLPSLDLVMIRIGMSEVIPVTTLRGQAPVLPDALPAPTTTRLAPELLAPETVLAAIDGRNL